MISGYPIFLDVSRRRVVIIGGGAVAARKASGLLAAGATAVRAIAPKFVKEFPAEVEKLTENFAPSHLDGAGLVFAATDSAQVNQAVMEEARKRGILVQRVDVEEDDPADFSTPAILRCGAISVAVSAAGSAALAAALRDLLAGTITDDWANLADALRRLRPKIRSSGLPIARRREMFRTLATADAAAALADGGMAGLLTWVRQKFTDFPELDPQTV